MGFDRHWLMLREPVDMRSREADVLSAAIRVIEAEPRRLVLDIGCGTGSTYRSIQPHLRHDTCWRLLDNDPALLQEVKVRHGDAVETAAVDLNHVETLPLDEVGFVTASALFDLCSADFMGRLARRLSRNGIGLYAALNYDGEMTWTDEHPLDLAVTATFNAHQLSDKGLGLSLGPDAWRHLAEVMVAEGYEVRIGQSPWVLKRGDAALHLSLLQGILSAAQEYGQLDMRDLIEWHDYRCRSAAEGRGLCHIGHRDLLARR
jgi:SAM-dependent methyltransferase